ncbi:MAG: A/G-specific adenine glycosylase [Firmicutes bacterium]|nr:A/G-specific adenine glycosylase [Bacillota bacterium]
MKYENISEGRFISRPNRFIAEVEMQDGRKTVHVKNTGRCRELLVPGAAVYLEKSAAPGRKTDYDLVAVQKDGKIVNMDSLAPNRTVHEWIASGKYFKDVTLIKPESFYKDSRFDFYVEAGTRKIYIEVKGVTLEKDRTALFPDAPSERALKHVEELIEAVGKGFEGYVIFVIQMKGPERFMPNREAQPEFADALQRAKEAGVHILAYDCSVGADEIELCEPVEVELQTKDGLLNRIAPPLLAWYDENRRILPWREKPEPYRVWVSEIMLQQTRVEAVKPYFARFMEHLPDVESLAAAEEDELLKLWEGLGYYSRARNLKAAAQQIVEQHGGKMPSEYHDLIKLKGIGSYTAGAISSIVFGHPVPAVDGNVLRVIMRLLADDSDISEASVRKRVEEDLKPVMPKDRPGDFNQALMELGATVCLPNGAPKCAECPWKTFCRAGIEESWQQYPKKAVKKPRTVEYRTILVIRDGHRAVIRRRPNKGLLAGMYEFPSLLGKASLDEVKDWLSAQGVCAVRIEKLPESKHIFTHKEWHMTGYMVLVDGLEPMHKDPSLMFVETQETEEKYPIPSAFSAYTGYLSIRTGSMKLRGEGEK